METFPIPARGLEDELRGDVWYLLGLPNFYIDTVSTVMFGEPYYTIVIETFNSSLVWTKIFKTACQRKSFKL